MKTQHTMADSYWGMANPSPYCKAIIFQLKEIKLKMFEKEMNYAMALALSFKRGLAKKKKHKTQHSQINK